MLSSRIRVKDIHTSRVETLFLFFMLLFGIPMIFLIPPGAGYDEEDHLVRVWEMARGSFLPGQLQPQEMQYPIVFRDFAYRQQGNSGVIDAEYWQQYGRASLYEDGIVRRELDTKSVYSPPLLLPQAIALRLFHRGDDSPALPVFYASRFASLISYLVLGWLSIRLIPVGKWIILVLALAPMALFQAATISPDAISNGIGFLFIAGSLKTTEQKEIGWKELSVLLLLIALLFLAKLNLIPLVLLLFLIMPPRQFAQSRMYLFLLAGTLILFLLEVAGWNALAAARSSPLLANEANPAGQLMYILSYPLSFLITLVKDLFANGGIYLQGWINGYGYYYWTPPLILSLFFLFSLGAALWVGSRREQINRQYRLAFLLVFLAGYVATVVPLYLTFTPVGLDQVFGVQGRYFIPLAPLLVLALSGISLPSKASVPTSRWITVPLTMALAFNLVAIFFSFHVPCGSTFYRADLCYQPFFRDFPRESRVSPPIAEDVSLMQNIQVACNGLGGVRIFMRSSGHPGITRFILQDSSSDEILLDTSVTNSQLPAEDWYPLRFQPDWQSAGKEYTFQIIGVESPASQGPQVLYTTQSEFDLGNLRENGQELQEDILLQYGCTTGLRKIWLTGKP